MEEGSRAKLSKGLLDMKFMKRTKDHLEKEADNAVGTALYSNEVTENMKKGELIFTEASMFTCANLIEGRLSFGGMNPYIEKLMQKSYDKRQAEVEKSKEKDISDADMAKNSALSQNIAKKFKTKNQKNQKKFHIPKPM